MVLGIAVYKFDLNPSSDGEIEPQFNIIASQIAQDLRKVSFPKMISLNELFGIFFHHTTGMSKEVATSPDEKNIFVGRLKETPYKVISYYRQEVDASNYLAIAFFKLDEDVEFFESLIRQLAPKLDELYLQLAQGNLKDPTFVAKVKLDMENAIKFTLFQIWRLSNLDKLQKIGLIFASPERVRTLQILRDGPVSRRALGYELEKIKANPNIDIILKPFLELNLVRRDWARGTKDYKTGVVQAEGEFIFLIKDVALVRQPPPAVLAQVKKEANLRTIYNQELKDYFSTYNPFANLDEESTTLAKYLLDPDLYDFLALLKEKIYPREKIPKISSEFASSQEVLENLRDGKIVTFLKDAIGTEWIIMLSEIKPLIVFPEYVISKAQSRLTHKGEEIDENDYKAPLTREVAVRELELLETTYGDKVQL